MFGNIISVNEYEVQIENISKRVQSSLLNVHIIFESDKSKIVGEIVNITVDVIDVIISGEFINGNFVSGNIHMPNINGSIRLINREEVISLLGSQEIESKDNVYIGKSLIYPSFNVSANINNLFSNHFAILGNTGSGKSSFVSRIIQNLFYRKNNIPSNCRIVLFDVYGEYHSAFSTINNTKNIRYKSLTTDTKFDMGDIVRIPVWFLDVDDLALLLGATSANQIPIIEKALRLVYLFTSDEEDVIAYKNNIIAKALMDILTGGKSSTQIRDQVIAVLTTYNTKDINLESKIVQPGYIRTLRQCLNIDQSGKINTIQLVIEYLENYINEEINIRSDVKSSYYTLKELYYAFEFALLSEGVLKSDKIYDTNNILKVRLDSIINGDYAKYFDVDNKITKAEFVDDLFINNTGQKVQLLNINLNSVDERFAKVLTKIYSKLFFNYCINLNDRGCFPINIILEEAHRYVQNDNDNSIIGYNIFDRIIKEGRKYGTILGFVTQRPSELSSTALSQCSNYIVLRMFHPEDLDVVRNITHSISESTINRLKTLRSGYGICFGNAFNLPIFVHIDRPNPAPNSSNSNIKDIWFKDGNIL